MSGEAAQFISIVMPALNEEGYIVEALDSITQLGADCAYEVLVMDGGSTDRTRALVEEYGRRNPRVKLVHNPKRLQSAAVNLAAEIAAPEATILVRADCHALYPAGFAEKVAASLRAAGSASVVVPMATVGVECFQKAVAAAQNSRLGNGGSAHRSQAKSRFIEHGHHAAFDRAAFRSVGGYDETFSHNEDAELDYRLTQAGHKIWLDAEVPVTYFPRKTLRSLARQYFNHGSGRARTFLKHRPPLKPRQFAPLFILLGSLGCLALSLLWPVFLLPPLAYAALCLGWGVKLALDSGDRCQAAAGIAAMTMHLSWATGFLNRVAKTVGKRG